MALIADSQLLASVAAMVGGFSAVAVALVFAIRLKAGQHGKREAIWRRFALDNRLNLTVEPGNWLRNGEFKIRGQIGEQDLELTTYRVQVGKTTQTWIKVRTQGRGPAGSFSVEHKNFLNRAGALLGKSGISVDSGEFDKEFMVHSAPESLAREVLDQPLRAHFASLARSPKLSYSDGACDLVWHARDETVEQLSAAVQMHALLRGAFLRSSRLVAR